MTLAHPQPQPSYGYNDGNYQQPAPYQAHPQPQYQQNYQPPPQQPQPNYQQPAEAKPPPPDYQPNVPQSGYSFDQAFKIEKPKWNDLWAGLLVRQRATSSTYQANTCPADRRFPWIHCRIRTYNPQVRDQQGLQRRRHLRLRQ